MVLRTLSKAYALAGARLGTLLASEDIVGLLRRIIPPYAIPASTVEEVLMLTEAPQRATAAARIRTLLDERARMAERLERCANVARVYPSDANFLLLECRDAAAIRRGRQGRRTASCATSRRIPGWRSACASRSARPAQNERLLAAVERRMTGARILFIDRDGTLVEEPPDEQVDSLAKVRLLPGVIPALLELRRAGYRFVMVSNQDGLGTRHVPRARFPRAAGLHPRALRVARHRVRGRVLLPAPPRRWLRVPQAPDRPAHAITCATHPLDPRHSYVIGDRDTDLQLAANLGLQGLRVRADGARRRNVGRHRRAAARARRARQPSCARRRKPTSGCG